MRNTTPTSVAIVGAGPLGGLTAYTLAKQYGVREIRLIDVDTKVAAGKALDIQQAGPVEGFDTTITAHGELHAAVGATAIVLTGPVGGTSAEWDTEAGAETVERLSTLNSHAPIICAGASHHRVMELGVNSAAVSRKRLLGSAPLAFVAALRAIVSLELAATPNDVSLSVLGVPPSNLVVPWSTATLRGVSLSGRLDSRRLARLDERARLLWPPGPQALAAAAAYMCRVLVLGFVERACPSFVVVDSEHGGRRRAVAMTATIDGRGVAGIDMPSLSTQERVQWDNALLP